LGLKEHSSFHSLAQERIVDVKQGLVLNQLSILCVHNQKKKEKKKKKRKRSGNI